MRIEMITAGSMFALASATASANVLNNWINWTAPASYGSSATINTSSYQYATTATGTLLMPDSSTVHVRLTGEVVSPTAFNSSPTAGGFGGPSGFSSNGTTISNYWSQLPDSGTTSGGSDGSAFLSSNVTTLPSNGDHIGLIGSGAATQTIEFFSDASFTSAVTVQNLLILVASLGSPVTQASWTFNQDFDILSDNAGTGYSGLIKTNPSAGDYVLSGTEGHGAIQFTGSFTSFSWSVSAPEAWAAWNLGGTNATAPSGAVPGVGGIAAIAGLGLARRRRRR